MSNPLVKKEIEGITLPSELHERSRRGIELAQSERESTIKRFGRKRITAFLLAVALMIPTGALAYQTLLADEYYGSFENLKKHVASATMEGYLLLDAKITAAKGDLSSSEYEQFRELLQFITASKLQYGNEYGYVDYSLMSAEELEHIKQVMYDIQPYFDQLNDQVSSKDVLTREEYAVYIDALIAYEQALSQSGLDGIPETDELPTHLQREFSTARAIIMYVNDLQLRESSL